MLTYLQLMNIAMNSLGRPDRIPTQRILPMNAILRVAIDGKEYQCFLKVIFIEHIDPRSLRMSGTFAFNVSSSPALAPAITPFGSSATSPPALTFADGIVAPHHYQGLVSSDAKYGGVASPGLSTTSSSTSGSPIASVADDAEFEKLLPKLAAGEQTTGDDEAWLDQLLDWTDGIEGGGGTCARLER